VTSLRPCGRRGQGGQRGQRRLPRPACATTWRPPASATSPARPAAGPVPRPSRGPARPAGPVRLHRSVPRCAFEPPCTHPSPSRSLRTGVSSCTTQTGPTCWVRRIGDRSQTPWPPRGPAACMAGYLPAA